VNTVRAAKVELFGKAGADRFDEALTAAHAFAQASKCPPGADVFRWLIQQHEALVYRENALRTPTHQTGEAS